MRLSLYLLSFLLCGNVLLAQTFTTVADGPWTAASTWDGGNVPPTSGSATADITIGHTVDIDVWVTVRGTTVNNGIINITSGNRFYTLGAFTNNTNMDVNGIFVPSGGVSENAVGGQVTVNPGGSIQTITDLAAILNNSGTIDLNNGGFNSFSLTMNNSSTGVININNSTFAHYGITNNDGEINASGSSGSITAYSQGAFPFLPNRGNINSTNGTITVEGGAFLSGDAIITIPSLISNGNVYPNFNGVQQILTIDGDLSGGSSFNSFWFEINGPTPGTDHAQLVVTGDVDLSATSLRAFGNYDAPVGATVDIIPAGNVTGTFTFASFPSLSGTKQWRVNYFDDLVQLEVIDPNAVADADNDGINDDDDNCPTIANADQSDVDGDGIGDVCDPVDNRDADGDGVLDADDNCPATPNADQSDVDGDGIGDVCDPVDNRDSDGDGVLDTEDNCPATANADQADCDGDGIGDVCDTEGSDVPVVDDISLPIDPQALGTSIAINATFFDLDDADGHSASIDWGDGSSSAGTVDQNMNTVSGSYTYAAAGVYVVTVSVTDACGETGSASSSAYAVIYDPSAGFVTGGGWIWSPAGAYGPDPSLEGKANFGFNAKYKKGQSVPDGKTTFHLNAAGFKFKSTDYEWLVIAGANAKFKGSGEVNGGGDYEFLLTGIDGDLKGQADPDAFRIKIWDRVTGGVVYDNKRGVADTDYDATEIGGGSIVIHEQKGKSLSSGDLTVKDQTVTAAISDLSVFPNPANEMVNLRFTELKADGMVVVRDLTGRTVAQRQLVAGQSTLQLNLGSNRLQSGVYMLSLVVGDEVQTRRLMIQR